MIDPHIPQSTRRDGNAAIDLYKAILLATDAAKASKSADVVDPFTIDPEKARQIVDQHRQVRG